MTNRVHRPDGGSALIMVLWLTAALSVITFALATTVRGEVERTETASQGVRAYYLATGSIERALLWMRWGSQYRNKDGSPRFYEAPMPRLAFKFPSGVAVVEIIPESAKYNINTMLPAQIFRLLQSLNVAEDRARALTEAIVDWRGPVSQQGSPFDSFYAVQPSSFIAPHASIQELEELLLIRGMTPELFYGNYARDPQGRAVWFAGLRDCLTVAGQDNSGFDVNTVEPAILATLNVAPAAIAQLIAYRNRQPIREMKEVADLFSPETAGRLNVGGAGSMVTLRASARLVLPDGTLSELKRTVSALVKVDATGQLPNTVLRWYDNAQSDVLPLPPVLRPAEK